EAVYKEWDDKVERAVTTAASLDAEHTGGNINRTQSTGFMDQTRSDRVPTPSYDLPLLGIHTTGSDEERFKQHELAEETKTAQNLVITRLKLRVKKLEKKKKKARTPQPIKRRLFKVRVESSADENIDEEDPSKQGRSMIVRIRTRDS
nr:hypothetical protein [Tanacetum cinerariifolium]